jgi:hypothetical protein
MGLFECRNWLITLLTYINLPCIHFLSRILHGTSNVVLKKNSENAVTRTNPVRSSICHIYATVLVKMSTSTICFESLLALTSEQPSLHVNRHAKCNCYLRQYLVYTINGLRINWPYTSEKCRTLVSGPWEISHPVRH